MRTVLYPIFNLVHPITERSLVECPGVPVPMWLAIRSAPKRRKAARKAANFRHLRLRELLYSEPFDRIEARMSHATMRKSGGQTG